MVSLPTVACVISDNVDVSLDKASNKEESPSGFKSGVSDAMDDGFLCIVDLRIDDSRSSLDESSIFFFKSAS